MAECWFFEVLPCRPPPYPDECLSSYVPRLAVANGICDLWSLVSDLFPRWDGTHQIGLLRWEYPLDQWGCLPVHSQLPLAVLDRLTVLAWVEKFRTPPPLVHPLRNGPGNFLHGAIAAQAQICPLCLQVAPYVRLIWRVRAVQVCLEHGCHLQTHCQHCHAPLRVIGDDHQHLRCGGCQADWRTLPITPAADEVLAEQERTQAALRFLLDPTVTLVRLPTDDGAAQCSVSEAVGLKFRYLRTLTACSIAAMAKRIGIADGTLSALELGHHVPLLLYLTYLEALDSTWPDFAALTISPEMLEVLTSPLHMALRQCPNPSCPIFEAVPSTQVGLLRDLPSEQRARFHCTVCGRRFTRSYAGHLTSKTSQTPPDPARGLKAGDEIGRLVAWGNQGYPNRWIAQQLGWGQKTVRQYWRALSLETEVHQAQAQRRAQEQAQRRTLLRTRIDAVLPSVLQPDQEVTLRMVARQLGYNPEYLQNEPELVAYVRSLMVPHNAQVRHRRYEATAARLQQLCAALPHIQERVTMAWFLEQLGLSWQCLQERYPELALCAQQAVKERQRQERQARTAEHVAQIDRAARRLIASGSRLTYKAILAEAKLSPYSDKSAALQQRLQYWVGSCPWEH